MKAFKMAQPKTLEGAQKAADADFATSVHLAAGTDLVAMLKERIAEPDTVVNLKGVAELAAGIRETDRGMVIGALTTLRDLAEHDGIAQGWPALPTTIGRSATPQVRNVATVAGNLCQRPRCSYFRNEHYDCLKKGGKSCFAKDENHEHHAIFDNDLCSAPHVSNLAPVLIAYGAEMDIATPEGMRTMSVEDFFVSPSQKLNRENVLGPKDVVVAVILPKGSASAKSAYVEARQKQSYDWALVGATANLVMDGDKVASCRIVLNAVAPTPQRRPDLEAMLVGKTPSAGRIDKVCEAAVAQATPLRDNGYKTIMLKAVLRRALRQAKEA
jgi:xanthine dehydrogenase YagS FAD-binding subunit